MDLTSPHPELTEDVDLVRPDGRLNPAAVGWTRRPHHRARFRRPDLRSKRWEWWGVVTPRHIVGMTVADARYAGLTTVHVLDRRTGEQTAVDVVSPLARGVALQPRSGEGTTAGGTASLSASFAQGPGGQARLQVRGRDVCLDAEVSGADRDSLGVVIPWSERRFQHTVKDVGRPVSGTLTLDGEERRFGGDGSFAVLDHGRGVWPYRMRWNWAAAAAMDGRDLALTLGGKWTDGTGATEDGLLVDGRLHKHHTPLRWEYDRTDWMRPWRISGQHADLTFHPEHLRVAATNLGIVSTTTHQAFGTFAGWVADTTGQRLAVDGLVGWAEEADNRW